MPVSIWGSTRYETDRAPWSRRFSFVLGIRSSRNFFRYPFLDSQADALMKNQRITIAPETLRAMEEQRMTPKQWAALALKAIPIRAKSWRSQAVLNVASAIQQAMGAGRRCRYCHRTYSGKVCDNMMQFSAHPSKIQRRMSDQEYAR